MSSERGDGKTVPYHLRLSELDITNGKLTLISKTTTKSNPTVEELVDFLSPVFCEALENPLTNTSSEEFHQFMAPIINKLAKVSTRVFLYYLSDTILHSF
jgi:hypothetical protein